MGGSTASSWPPVAAMMKEKRKPVIALPASWIAAFADIKSLLICLTAAGTSATQAPMSYKNTDYGFRSIRVLWRTGSVALSEKCSDLT